jgi:hypothetical protein
VLRVPRDSAEEQALVGMLLGCEPDLVELSQPMAFPVFGRGRALLPLVGAGITAKNVHDAAEFLAGPCSCEVKEQNPGFDLLLKADWRDLLGQAIDTAVAAEIELPAEPEFVTIPRGAAAIDVPADLPEKLTVTMSHTEIVRPNFFWPLVGGAVVVVLLAAMGLVVLVQGAARRPGCMHRLVDALAPVATDGTIRSPGNLNRPKAHLAQVNRQEFAGERLAHAGEELDGFHRGERAHGTGHGAEHGEFSFPIGRRLGIETGQARGLAGQHGHQTAFELIHRTIDQRFFLADGLAVKQ